MPLSVNLLLKLSQLRPTLVFLLPSTKAELIAQREVNPYFKQKKKNKKQKQNKTKQNGRTIAEN